MKRRAKKSIDKLSGFFINQIKRVDEIKLKLEQSLIAIEAQQFTEKSQYEKKLFDLDKSILQREISKNRIFYHNAELFCWALDKNTVGWPESA